MRSLHRIAPCFGAWRSSAGALLVAAIVIMLMPSAAGAAPTVSPIGLQTGDTVAGKVSLDVTAGSDADQVKWYIDFVEVAWDGTAPWQADWDSTAVPDGPHTLMVKAAGADGEWGTSALVRFTVVNTVPSEVALLEPAADASVADTITLAATASDPDGISEVKWYVDGREVYWDGAEPWQGKLDTTTLSDGRHAIFAKAATGRGAWMTSAVQFFTVANAAPTTSTDDVSSRWRLVMSDNFDAPSLDTTKWRVYGPNWRGHNGNGLRDGRAISIQDGTLTVTARMIDNVIVSGGVSSRIEQAYGRYEFRARADPDPSEATSGVVLTWPESNNFPIEGENDIWETLTNGNRWPMYSFIHYGSQNWQYWFHHNMDGTQWHRMAMEWEPDEIRIYRDGALVWKVTDANAIPDVRHHLCIQLDAFKTWVSGAPRIQVDDVRIYERATPE